MKYIIFGSEFPLNKKLYSDVLGLENVIYLLDPCKIKNRILRKVFFILCLKVKMFPMKEHTSLLFEKLDDTDTQEDRIFIYHNPWVSVMANCGYVEYLKKKFPNSYHVVYLIDIHAARSLNLSYLKNVYDEIFIFDKEEAKRLNINYYPLLCSKYDCLIKNENLYSDIVFVGQAKDRLNELFKLFEKLSQYGLKCKFYISGVEKEKQKYKDQITYGEFLSPEKAFEYLYNSQCVLELKVGDCTSYSNRILEAISYNKKILTNNPYVKENKYYNPAYIQIYDNIENIDKNFFFTDVSINYHYKGDYSPVNFLAEIEKAYLSKNRNKEEIK